MSATSPHDIPEAEYVEPEPFEPTLEQEPLPKLIRRLADETATLFTQEFTLLKTEMLDAVTDARRGAMSAAIGTAVTFAGVIFLLASATLALSEVMESWLAALIVGGVVAIIGLIVLRSGMRKLEPASMTPEHTAASLKRDRDMIRRAAS